MLCLKSQSESLKKENMHSGSTLQATIHANVMHRYDIFFDNLYKAASAALKNVNRGMVTRGEVA
jgi:hypothetical protein